MPKFSLLQLLTQRKQSESGQLLRQLGMETHGTSQLRFF